MAITASQYLFLWQSVPLLFNAFYVSAFPDRYLHPSCLPYENTLPALHVSSELALTAAAYFLLAAYRRDHGMMKVAIPLRMLAAVVGVRDGGMWVRVGLYEAVMGGLTAWAVGREGGW